jgi:hypothetical protein
MNTNPYWTNTNLGEVAYREIQAALAKDKAIQEKMPRFTDMGEKAHQRNMKAINRIMADIDEILTP